MNIERLKEVFLDEAFVKSLFELETVAEVQAALREKGIELTEEEILGVRDLLIKVEEGGISAEQLESLRSLALRPACVLFIFIPPLILCVDLQLQLLWHLRHKLL